MTGADDLTKKNSNNLAVMLVSAGMMTVFGGGGIASYRSLGDKLDTLQIAVTALTVKIDSNEKLELDKRVRDLEVFKGVVEAHLKEGHR